jgi:hypothetical protein
MQRFSVKIPLSNNMTGDPMRAITFPAAFLAYALASHPAAADDLLGALFGDWNSPACFGRTFSTVHFAAHPDQRVETFRIDVKQHSAPESEGPKWVEVGVSAAFRPGGDRDGKAVAICENREPAVFCEVQGEGRFTLARQGKTEIEVRMEQGIIFETASGFIDLAASDDSVFVLDQLASTDCAK